MEKKAAIDVLENALVSDEEWERATKEKIELDERLQEIIKESSA